MSSEASRILNFLAAIPAGNASASEYFDIVAKRLGGGVYRVTLSRAAL